MGEEREKQEGEREVVSTDEVEGHTLDTGDRERLDSAAERERVAAGDDVEGHMLDPGALDPGNVRAE